MSPPLKKKSHLRNKELGKGLSPDSFKVCCPLSGAPASQLWGPLAEIQDARVEASSTVT